MPFVKVGEENGTDIEVHYEDRGTGTPVVLSHGYPLSGKAWEKQVSVLIEAGHRVVTYDRRGWGNSSQPATGYDYDTFAADLDALMEELDLRDAVLVGHSMGTGDVTHYIGRYGSGRVAKAVLVSPIPPFLLQTQDNPEGVPQALFDGFVALAESDRPEWMKQFLENFYNYDVNAGTLVSEDTFRANWEIAVAGSPVAAVACIPTWLTDFRPDLPELDIPVLVIAGDKDRILPAEVTADRLDGLIKDLRTIRIAEGPHAIAWTHSDQVNNALLDFLR